MKTEYSEDTLVEQPTIELFSELESETANCLYEKVGTSGSTLGRETTAEVIHSETAKCSAEAESRSGR